MKIAEEREEGDKRLRQQLGDLDGDGESADSLQVFL